MLLFDIVWRLLLTYGIQAELNVEDNNSGIMKAGDNFENTLLKWFQDESAYELAKRDIKSLIEPRIRLEEVDIMKVADDYQKQIDNLLSRRIEALRKLVDQAETGEQTIYEFSADVKGKYPDGVDDMEAEVRYDDVKKWMQNENTTGAYEQALNEADKRSAVHIPVETIRTDFGVLRDIEWTGSDGIKQVFLDNRLADSTIRQFIGTEKGITRMFPGDPWLQTPVDITIDLYEPKSRPWYVAATTDPKDIMFLVDYSGSVHGQTLALIKTAILVILATLTTDDYINAVWFNKDYGNVLQDCFSGFVPATFHNKKLLRDRLEMLKPSDQARFEPALNFSLRQLKDMRFNASRIDKEMRSDIKTYHRSGAHQLLMVLSDGIESISDEKLSEYASQNVRVFGMAMGFSTAHIDPLWKLSCQSNGYYSLINSLGDVRHESLRFREVLSRPMALSLRGVAVEQRRVAFSGPYLDVQGHGPVITLSMPILCTLRNCSKQNIVGVAGVDVKLSELLSLVPESQLGGEAVVFVTNNNGEVIFHPDLDIPDPDLQLIRRTACIAHADSELHTGRILYSVSTEQVYRQMGLMDSLKHYDILQLEQTDVDLVEELRRAMIDGRCNAEKYYSRSQHGPRYTCRRLLADSPYSLGVGVRRPPAKVELFDDQTAVLSPDQLRTLFAPLAADGGTPRRRSLLTSVCLKARSLCRGALDLMAIPAQKRFQRLASHIRSNNCELDETTDRLKTEYIALTDWIDSWGILAENETCYQFVRNQSFSFRKAFIQTGGGLSVIFPDCRHECEHSATDFQRNNSSERLTFAVTDDKLVTVTRSVRSSDNKLELAVVGLEVNGDFVQNRWMSAVRSNPIWKRCQTRKKDEEPTKICDIVNENLELLATNRRQNRFTLPVHLGVLDWPLLESMASKTELNITNNEVYNYQAMCDEAEMARLMMGSSSRPIRLATWTENIWRAFTNIISLLVSFLWWDTHWLLRPAPVQAAYMGGDGEGGCLFSSSDERVSCVTRQTRYRISRRLRPKFATVIDKPHCSPSSDSVTSNDAIRKRPRTYEIGSLNNSNLYLIVSDPICTAEGACLSDDNKCLSPKAIDAKIVLPCDEVRIRYRKRRSTHFTTQHPDEDGSICGAVACFHTRMSPIAVVTLISFLRCL